MDAVIAVTRQIAVDCAADGIDCNALCRGFGDTPFDLGFEQQTGAREAGELCVGMGPKGAAGADLGESRGILPPIRQVS